MSLTGESATYLIYIFCTIKKTNINSLGFPGFFLFFGHYKKLTLLLNTELVADFGGTPPKLMGFPQHLHEVG